MEDADSGSIDMEAAVESIGADLFPESVPEGPVEDKPVVQTEEVQETQEGLAGKEPQEEPKEEPQEEPKGRPAPQSWKKEMHGFWDTLDPTVQSYVEQREEQMREGLEKDRGDANLGRTMRDVMSPYSQMLQQQGVDEAVMVRNLMNAHYRLSTASPEEKTQLINQLAQHYGVSQGEQQEVDPALKAVQDKVNSLEQHLTAAQRQSIQEARERVEKDVEAFASDPKHEFFDEVSEQIVPLINAGYSLEDAYQNAIWLNPVTRQKEVDRAAKEAATKAEEAAKQEAEKARKAKSANVRGRDTSKASTEPTGTMEDTMREVYRDIQSRSH